MPVILPKNMPTLKALQLAGIRAFAHDSQPLPANSLQVAILNLMPNKEETELQFLVHLAASPRPIAVTFISLQSYQPQNTSLEYLSRWYQDFSTAAEQGIDGLIITGAPLEHMEFAQVRYWQELKDIMDYSRTHISTTLFICWAAPAALWHHYKIPMSLSPVKISGLYPHGLLQEHPLLAGLPEPLSFPHSRYFFFEPSSLAETDLQVLALSEAAGIGILASPRGREIYVAGHLEYSRDTLQKEYARDLTRGLSVPLPANYFPDNNPELSPTWAWRDAAQKFFHNWLAYCEGRKCK